MTLICVVGNRARYDPADVKAAARGRWAEVLATVASASRPSIDPETLKTQGRNIPEGTGPSAVVR